VLPYLRVGDRGIHPVLKAVRSTYRAQYRKPQFEPICVDWIERFVRTYPTRPVGTLGSRQVRSFLSVLAEQGESPERQRQAHEALHFFQTEVLRQV
jgi:hypothetical protein